MPKPQALILLTHEYAPFRGGAATYVREIALAAMRLGLPVEVWAPDRGRSVPDVDDGFPVVRLRCSGKLGPGIVQMAWALARQRASLRHRSVILLSAGAHMAWALLHRAGILPAARVTAFFHGSEVLKFERAALWRRLSRRMYGSAHGLAVASEYVRGLVRGSSFINGASRDILLAPCAAPSEVQALANDPVTSLPGEGRLVVLTVGRLHPRKGQVELAQALGRLSPGLRDRVVYQMVGTGEPDYRRQIEAACRLAGVVWEFKGALDVAALANCYRRCDLYAQSSRTLSRSVEGFGISYLEAAAFGKPSVGVDTGGVGEAVIDGVTGVIVPEGNPAALTNAIARLLEDPELRSRYGAAGRRHAASFSWERSARALYEAATGSGRAAPQSLHPHGKEGDIRRGDPADPARLT